jgi:hypothetical protein
MVKVYNLLHNLCIKINQGEIEAAERCKGQEGEEFQVSSSGELSLKSTQCLFSLCRRFQ